MIYFVVLTFNRINPSPYGITFIIIVIIIIIIITSKYIIN